MIALDLDRASAAPDPAVVRRIGSADLRWALQSGWRDFQAKRGDIIFVALLYPLIGLMTAAIALNSALLPLFFPTVAGLSILGPIVAAGFYEIARRREQGDEAGWSHFLDPLERSRRGGIVGLTAMLIVLFVAWLLIAALLYQVTVGVLAPVDLSAFVRDLLTTPQGWTLILLGNAVGAVIAAATLVLTVVSVPMVVDRPVSAMAAVQTSIRAVAANPGAMARWGAIVATMLLIGAIPLFIGLAIVLPVLGYATWHLYTRVVER